MKKTDFIIGFLILMNVILVAIIIDMRETSKIKVNEIVVQSDKEKIVFAGDSITDQYDVTSYYQYKDKLIINSGIGGYQTTDMLRRFDNLIEQHQADK